MSSLLNHSGTNPDKNVDIKVKSVSRQEAGFASSETPLPTFDVNMRIDNHSRNAVLALAKITADKRSASEMVSILVEEYLKELNPKAMESYTELVDAFEEKDKITFNLKKR